MRGRMNNRGVGSVTKKIKCDLITHEYNPSLPLCLYLNNYVMLYSGFIVIKLITSEGLQVDSE